MSANARQEQLQQQLKQEHEAGLQEAMDRLSKTASQYLLVYGEPGKRSEAQEQVFKDLRQNGFYDRPMFGASPAGTVDPLVLAFSEGKRAMVLTIDKMILLATDRKELEAHVRNQYTKK